MKEDGFAARRDRFRAAVIDPLLAMGMRKRRNMSAEAFEEQLAEIARRCAHMDPKWHDALREVIEHNAEEGAPGRGGRAPRHIFPDQVTVLNWARALSPLGDRSELVVTYMGSAAGAEAWARSEFEASELERYLERYRRPPCDQAPVIIRERGEEKAAQFARLQERAAKGRLREEDVHRLAAWKDRRRYLEALITGRPG